MEELTIKINEFEGPLDLLLHLIKEYKMDIYDIQMVELTNQYLTYIHSMKEMELEIAGDYLVMAATLLEIKARTLLPKPTTEIEIGEDLYEEDPRQELVERLIEYKKVQATVKTLEELSQKRSLHYSKQATDLTSFQDMVPLKEGELTTQDLWNALKKMAQRTLAKQPLQANLYHEVHTIEDVMDNILTKVTLSKKEKVPFVECFPEFNRHAIVTTFLAMLQLVRDRSIMIVQRVPYEDIYIVKRNEKDEYKK
ncbi:condensin subunit ScpA [Granulicatella balaenopterae]|uniref:Segregation and condensation protein A n=1 Tax=Granulicatella balaenopterae TaxID=137733 RepID=A0A1H9HTZ2_9LACT|nr:segregation/condensation protein A [Granulicatella balaenopterae]SEQ65804.1 condensin subunit ScpA [Granulicatella balaenopterae]